MSRIARKSSGAAFPKRLIWFFGIAALVTAMFSVQPVMAETACSRIATLLLKACRSEIRDDFWETSAACNNISDADERAECGGDVSEELSEGADECREQVAARVDLCDQLDEDRYDPEFDPLDFETEFTNLNSYLPIAVGNRWVYTGGDETTTVEVMNKTKLIEGVTCIVVNDIVSEDGRPLEDTDDWFGQAINGDVHYCGEISMDFEVFEGDDPEEPELVEIEGSWKAGRDGARPGILMFAAPQVGTTYRQELSLGDAEDAAEILSNDYGFGEDPDLDQLVPQALAELLCNNDCVVTRDFSPLEPGAEERKYHAPGIGMFLEVNLEDGEINQLTGCNVDPLCMMLPMP